MTRRASSTAPDEIFCSDGARVREHLHVDAGGVHVLQARLAGVLELLDHMRRRRGIEPGEQRVELRIGVVFFERDDRDIRLLQQGVAPVF